jgi:Zn-dependent peptidase ImmA (M78 family)/transcriptional regulator with XRE-family HTH domain
MVAQHVPINPAVLAWALREAGAGPKELAGRLGVERAVVDAWLHGSSRPNLTLFRKLATTLHRPSATFLLPEPPKSAIPAVQFRHPPDAANRQLGEAERLRLREAGRLQRGLRWILDQTDHRPLDIPLESTATDPEVAAHRLRQIVGVTPNEQTGWKSDSMALREWRRALEALGIAVLLLPMGSDSARGFSFWDDLVPVIAVNTHWNPAARIFTMFHELGHLISRTSSVCQDGRVERHKDHGDPVERWCERFAAAFLLPWPDASRFLSTKYGWTEGREIHDLKVASALARRFKVSLRASVLRLIDHKAAQWKLFTSIPKNSDAKTGGGGGGGRTRPQIRADEYGRRTATILFDGMQRDVLSRDDVLGYLNIGDAELSTFETDALAG